MSKRRCPQPLSYDDIKSSPERRTRHEEGKLLLANLMNRGEIAVTSAKLSLKCKLMRGRINVPVRSINCRPHFECFDLRHYLDCEAENSTTIGAPTSSRTSQRPLWACPVCGEVARAEDLRVDDYFAHILKSVPASIVDVQLLPDGSFEQVPHPEPEVTIDEEEPFESEPEQLRAEPSGPSRAVEEVLKQSKSFQGTLRSFRTKKDLLEKVESFHENQREAQRTSEETQERKPEESAVGNGLAIPRAPKELSQEERDKAYSAILKRLWEDTDNVWPFLVPVPHEVESYYDTVQFPICLVEVEQKVLRNEYHHERLFIADFKLMFSNCYKCNNIRSPYYEMGYNPNKKFLALCKQHFPNSTMLPQLPRQNPNVSQLPEQKPNVKKL